MVFMLISASLILPDIFWRESRFQVDIPKSINEGIGSAGSMLGTIQRVMTPPLLAWKRVSLYQGPFQPSLLRPSGVIKFFGLVFLVLLVGYLIFVKDKKKDKILIIPTL